MKIRKRVEIILPVYNEVHSILPLLKALDRVIAPLSTQYEFNYLFVNDGSEDGSRELLHDLYEDREDIRILHFIHNFGHAAAIDGGLKHFVGDAAILMDADLQDAPEAIPKMLEAWDQGSDTVVAERGDRSERHGFLFQLFYFLLAKLSSSKTPPIAFGTFCLLDKKIINRILNLGESNRYFPSLVSYASDRITSIRVNRRARVHGNSRVGILGLFSLAITAFLSFSNLPVRLASLMGILCSAFAILGLFVILGIKVFTPLAIPGWASIMIAISFGSGVQLLCLGIMGEYVSRIYDEVKKRPSFFVESMQEHPVLTSQPSERKVASSSLTF